MRDCTCAGTAPGYPQHESYCDLMTGGNTAARELEEAELSRRRRVVAETAAADRLDPWARPVPLGGSLEVDGVRWTAPAPF